MRLTVLEKPLRESYLHLLWYKSILENSCLYDAIVIHGITELIDLFISEREFEVFHEIYNNEKDKVSTVTRYVIYNLLTLCSRLLSEAYETEERKIEF